MNKYLPFTFIRCFRDIVLRQIKFIQIVEKLLFQYDLMPACRSKLFHTIVVSVQFCIIPS